jgi:hypothetical protein
MFMLFGPNTNSITNTIVFLLERQARYIRQALEYKESHEVKWLDVNPETYRNFQDWLQQKLDKTVFTDNCPGWYTNDEGKVTAMWPASHLAYAHATAKFHPERYTIVTTAQTSLPTNGPIRDARSMCELFDRTASR